MKLLSLFLLLLLPLSAAATGQERAYTVTIEGLLDKDLKDKVEEASELIRRRKGPPPTSLGLRQRMADDRATLRNLLRSEGYYGGSVEISLKDPPEQRRVLIKIVPGTAYLLEAYRLVPVDPTAPGPDPPVALTKLGVTIGARARAEMLVKARQRLLVRLAERARPLAKIVDQRVVVDHGAKRVRATLRVSYGPATTFGATRLKGTQRLEAAFIRRRLKWKPAAPFDSRIVGETRADLLGTGLFDSVKISHADRAEPGGALPMMVEVKERKPRTFAIGATYSTSSGPGGKISWTHRNLFGGAERLDLSAEASFIEYAGKAKFRMPDLFSGPQDLLLGAEISAQRFDSYDADILGLSAIIERRFGRRWRGSAGVTFEQVEINDAGKTEDFSLLGGPTQVRYDSTNDLLSPVRGVRLKLDATPYTDVARAGLNFAQIIGSASTYLSVTRDERVVLAAWARAGIIIGERRDKLPASKRLYSGGGGSVRGFGFQKIGPLDASNDPLGGNSKLEFGLEARFRILKNWGAVAFVEAGNVATRSDFRFAEAFRVGVGVGVRYFTGFGPLRIDIGVPLNRRSSDGAFQIYVGIGQAF